MWKPYSVDPGDRIEFVNPRTGETVAKQFKVNGLLRRRIRGCGGLFAKWQLALGTTESIPAWAWLLPEYWPLPVCPAMIFSRKRLVRPTGLRKFSIMGATRYLDTKTAYALPVQRIIDFPWMTELAFRLVAGLIWDELSYASALHLQRAGDLLGPYKMGGACGDIDLTRCVLGDCPLPPKEGIYRDFAKHLTYLMICIGWPFWEEQRIKWEDRAAMAVEHGFCRHMREDNFRKVCKSAGLFHPRLRKP